MITRRSLLAALPPSLLAAVPALGAILAASPADAPQEDAPSRLSAARDGLALMRIDGEALLVDLNTYQLDGTADAVVIGWDGKMQIGRPVPCEGHRFIGERSGMTPRIACPYETMDGVAIVGKIVERMGVAR